MIPASSFLVTLKYTPDCCENKRISRKFPGGFMKIRCAILFTVLLMAGNFAWGADDAPLLATEPTVNKTEIVFVYGGYLWSVPRAGGEARQLTTGGHESAPYFSPDGKWIAFMGQYDGNQDVYV